MTAGGDRDRVAPRWLGAESLPACFRDLSRPPAGLWYLGDPEALQDAPDRHVAIVGTRDASPYGIRTAERLATACAKAGLVVVSGVARGVDAAAHRAALAVGGRTVGVQGTGVDVPYPVSHRVLHRALADSGTLLSEMEPGTTATPGCFPRRNRLIAALCRVTVVVEAGYRSGAINTASQALDLGRTVAAVPGRIDEERSAGANLLIRDGAQVVATVDDLLGLYGLSTLALGNVRGSGVLDPSPGVGDDASASVLARLNEYQSPSVGSDEILHSASFRQLAGMLLEEELNGRIRRDGAGYHQTASSRMSADSAWRPRDEA